MAIVFVSLDAHDVMAITKAARNAIRQPARQQDSSPLLGACRSSVRLTYRR
jgi:hypothetical protein